MARSEMKLLVANRSEIACRVFQAARELGITTVGIHTSEDFQARHVTYADEIAEIPSYLKSEAILAVAKQKQVNLIHPGYGFLSERPLFARAVREAGIRFIGPAAETMELLGEKIAAKKIAEKAGVPTLPWVQVHSGEDPLRLAQAIGFPLLVKASAGGGGKGMRQVFQEKDLQSCIESAVAEAQSVFGDGEVFLEKILLKPRHIEVQVFGDGKGNGIHLFERECSLQRRHQKIWEEAPAPRLSERTRQELCEAALKLVFATRYENAGTVEFLVDGKENFYFLEMNTRLQVEHPVTELISGTDLVRMQIQQALGNPLPPQPERPLGHAIEVRLYAEDPSQGFVPSPGRILQLRWPTGAGIRVESGVEEGQEVQLQFDSMMAKLITLGVDREHALARMRYALDETVLLGPGSNQRFLRSLCDEEKVVEGDVYTQFIEKEFNPATGAAEDIESAVLALLKSARISGVGKGKTFVVSGDGGAPPPSPWFELGNPL